MQAVSTAAAAACNACGDAYMKLCLQDGTEATPSQQEKPLAEAAQDHALQVCTCMSRMQVVSTAHALKIQRCRPLQPPFARRCMHESYACRTAHLKQASTRTSSRLLLPQARTPSLTKLRPPRALSLQTLRLHLRTLLGRSYIAKP